VTTLDVHLVTPEREVWAGEARFVVARSISGELGVLPGHEPTLAALAIGPVKIEAGNGEIVRAVVDGGFLSVGQQVDGVTRVDVLAEHVSLMSEIDAESVRGFEQEAERLRNAGDEDGARAAHASADARRHLSAEH